jgi:tRNA (pseudouridine54-N1)-methyltransferase
LAREFILFSRLGKTDASFRNLHDAGRLDIVHECIVASFFLSHGLRRNVLFHAILNGPPNPPLHIEINGAKLYNVRTDVYTWQNILRNTISGRTHPGILTSKNSFEAVLKKKSETSHIFVLEEGGSFALRFGEKISLGKHPYLAASCITIINYLLDRQIKSRS